MPCFIVVISTLHACGVPVAQTSSDGGSVVSDAGQDSPMVDGVDACKQEERDTGDAEPTGTRLQAGDALSVRGVTADGYVIFSDDVALRLAAVELTGGSTKSLGPLGSKFWVSVQGNVVFAWSSVASTGQGALSVWTASTGLHAIAPASYGLLAAASADGSQILYVDGVDATGTTGDVSMAQVDGTGAKKLLRGVHVAGCFPQLGFVGTFALSSHCDGNPGPSFSSAITSFSLPSLARTDLVTHAANYWSASATRVFASTSHGVLLVPIGGGPTEMVDKTGFIGQLSTDGQTTFYSTMSHAFRRSPAVAPSPTTLVQKDFGGLYSLSGDDAWALYYWSMGNDGSDLYLTGTAAHGTPTTLSSTTNAGIVGDAFTADSTHALYVTDVDPCNDSGALHARALDGTSDVILGHGVWLDRATSGGKVVFSENYLATGGLRFGRADIAVADTAHGGAATRVVSGADVVVQVTPDLDQVVYSWSLRPGSSGLYLARLP
jgi:hypothetical protein